ncbi:MAG TPA: flippase [Candidatus Hypogeohydataceae bacterium YC41]
MSKFPGRKADEVARDLPAGDDPTADQHRSNDPIAINKSFDSGKVFGNILALGTGEIVARVVAFFGTTYLAQELGPAGFGIIGFTGALCGYFSLAVYAGFDQIGAREVARRPHEASAIATSVILVRLALAFVALAAIATVACFLDKPPTVKLTLVLTGLLFFSLALDTSWVYKGLELNRPVGLALVLGQVLYVGTLLLVVRGPGDVMLVPLAQFLGEMGAALLLAVSLFHLVHLGEIKLNLREGLRILRSSGSLTILRVLRTLIFTFDVVLLGFLLGEREVGLYTASYRVCFLLLAISTTIHISYLPGLTRALDQSIRQVSDLAVRSVELSSVISIPMIVGGMILAGPLLTTLFGPEYLEAVAPFRLLLLSIGFIFIFGAIHNILLVCNRMKVEMWIVAAAAGLNIVLNLILIPRYGLVGAAFATVLAEGLNLLMGLLAIYEIGIRLDLRPVLRPLLAAGMMGAGLLALGLGQGLALCLGEGFIIYVLALAVFRGIPQDAQPLLRKLAPFANALHERFRGVWHFWIGPMAQ